MNPRASRQANPPPESAGTAWYRIDVVPPPEGVDLLVACADERPAVVVVAVFRDGGCFVRWDGEPLDGGFHVTHWAFIQGLPNDAHLRP